MRSQSFFEELEIGIVHAPLGELSVLVEGDNAVIFWRTT